MNKMMNERAIERWMRLRTTGSVDGTLEVPSISSGVDTGFGPIRWAIGPAGEPRLLVPCGSSTQIPGSSGKLLVKISRYEVAGRNTLFIDVMCLDRSLDSVFADLAEEVVHRVAGGASAANSVEGTIADFRDLLGGSQRDIPDHTILGLIGELFVLRLLSRISANAIDAWTGPFEQRHDFRRRNLAIEVKTSGRRDSTSVSISSCDQLTEPAGGSLILVHIKLERTSEGALSVASLSGDILATGASQQSLESALIAIGCHDAHAPAWNRLQYTFESMHGYRIGDGFPRIVSEQFPHGVLPQGVESLEYRVDLRAASAFLMSGSELEMEFSRVAV
jgi:hypothetical protein